METSSLTEVFIGRQPVLDRRQTVIGYELLFRRALENRAMISSGREATAGVVCNAFAELGLAKALGSQRAFINMDEDFLCDDVVELLPSASVLLEVPAAQAGSTRLVERCRDLRSRGYQICITGITAMDDGLVHAMAVADFVKVDTGVLANGALAAVAKQLRKVAPPSIASRVESMDQMHRCADLGFQFFQGYYFAKPVVIEGRKLDASAQGLLHIIDLINRDADLGEIEDALKHQPALAVNLLRLTNSVGVGLSVRVTSVGHAVTIIGRRQLLRWLQLLLFARPGATAIAENPLMQLAALRGDFLEQLALRRYPAQRQLPDLAFLTGLLSLMPAALGLSMTDILGQIAVAHEVRLALSRREGELGHLLQLTECYDNNDQAGTDAALAAIGQLDYQMLGECLASAISWVQQLDIEAKSD
jgi:EAL and modified HD-GYP domain-containing signal transduction protein